MHTLHNCVVGIQDSLEAGTFLLPQGGTSHSVEGIEHQWGTVLQSGTALVKVEGTLFDHAIVFKRKQQS